MCISVRVCMCVYMYVCKYTGTVFTTHFGRVFFTLTSSSFENSNPNPAIQCNMHCVWFHVHWCPFECRQYLMHVCFPVSDLCPAVGVLPHSRPLDGCTTATRWALVALVVCQCSANWGREEGTIPSVHIPRRTRTPAKELSPSAREEFECRPVTEWLKDWPWQNITAKR